MKKIMIFLAIAIALFTACEPTAGGGGGGGSNPGVWSYADVVVDMYDAPGVGAQYIVYEAKRSRSENDFDWVIFYVGHGDSTAEGYDSDFPYVFGFIYSTKETFLKESLTTFTYTTDTLNNTFDLSRATGFSGPADVNINNGEHVAGVIWTLNQAGMDAISQPSEISVTLKGPKHGDITRTIPIEFSQYLTTYF